ncbi:MAG: FtsX-like permease family protein [Rhodospirillaceae bacterium]
MTNALRIARRELRGGLRGFRVFLSCLALGVAAIAAVGSIASSVIAGLEEDGAILLGGDASLRVTHRDISAEQRAWLDDTAEISRIVYLRSMARATAGERRSLVEMKMVDGAYPLYGELETEPPLATAELLERRDGIWGAAVDSALLTRLGVDVGGQVEIGDTAYQIRAVIDREPDRVSGARALQLGPRFIASADSVTDTGLVQPGSQVWYFYRVRLADPGSLDAWKTSLDRAFPDAQWVVEDRTDASPTVKRLVDRTTLFMTLVGLTALLVGGVGVGNSVRDFLAGKIDTIATLKCLGASSQLIFTAYLAQVLAMACLGIAIGLAVGGILPALIADLIRDALPVAARIRVFWEPLALAAAFGFLTALAFSIWPLARACELPAASLFRDAVAHARGLPRWPFVAATLFLAVVLGALAVATARSPHIAMWFVGGSIATMILFGLAGMLIARTARLAGSSGGTVLRLALANLHRPGAPTGSVVMSLGLGLTVLVTVALIETNLSSQITKSLPERAPGYFFIDIQNDQAEAFEDTVSAVDGFRDMRLTPMLRGNVTRVKGIPASDYQTAEGSRWVLRGDRGITWSRELPEGETVVAGEWWPPDHAGEELISLSAREAENLGVGIGDTMTVNILGRNVTGRIANLRNVEWGTLQMNFVFIFSPGVLQSAPQTHLATLHADPAKEAAIERAVATAFPNVTTIRVRDVLDTVNGFLGRLGTAVRLTAGVAILAGTLVLAGAIAAGHRRRVYDSVILKVLGATRRRIMGTLLLEYGLLGLFTALVSSVIGTVAAWAVVTQVMNFEFLFSAAAVAATCAIAVAITLAFGFYGTWRALGQKAAPLLRNE